jgi:hypothetical protein
MSQVRILRIAAMVLIVGAISCARAQTSETDATASRTEVVRTVNAGTHRATVRIGLSALDPTDRLLSLWRTDSGYRPLNAISEVSIEVDGQAIFIPLGAVLDIYDPHDVQLTATPDGYLLEIVGADASESYEARIWFDEVRVLRREIVAFGEVSESAQYNLIVVE